MEAQFFLGLELVQRVTLRVSGDAGCTPTQIVTQIVGVNYGRDLCRAKRLDNRLPIDQNSPIGFSRALSRTNSQAAREP
jgi:hypothetical protein